MVVFIDEYRHAWGVEPICAVLPIAPATYYQHKAWESNPEVRPTRQKSDALFRGEIQRVWKENREVYGAKKVWRQLNREGIAIARCAVERLMKSMGLEGVVRGKVKRTTVSADADPRPLDLVQRQFHAARPNQLWVADFTYVATGAGWQSPSFRVGKISQTDWYTDY